MAFVYSSTNYPLPSGFVHRTWVTKKQLEHAFPGDAFEAARHFREFCQRKGLELHLDTDEKSFTFVLPEPDHNLVKLGPA